MGAWLSTDVALEWVQDDGEVRVQTVSSLATSLRFEVQDNGALRGLSQLRNLARLEFVGNPTRRNGPWRLPEGIGELPLVSLLVFATRLDAVSPDLAAITSLVYLDLSNNCLESLPAALGQMQSLRHLSVSRNALRAVPSELSLLIHLMELDLSYNQLSWLPLDLLAFESSQTRIGLNGCPLAIYFATYENARPRLAELMALTAHIGTIRARATEICVALAELELSALVTLEIVDAALANNIRMAAKWDLIVAVKHFHDRNQRRL